MKRIMKISSVLLALSMLITMLPAGAYASSDAWDGTSIDVLWYNTTDTEFTIKTPAQLAGLAAIVNGTAEGIEKDSFAGKTVNLGADIDLGNKSWTPIGRRTGLSAWDSFSGCFDGGGYSVSNLIITYDLKDQIIAGSPLAQVGAVGFFGSVEGTAENHAIIKQLKLDGKVNITSNGSTTVSNAVGFAGLAGKSSYTDFIDCIVDVDVTNNNNSSILVGRIGGITGDGKAITITRCANLGDVNGNGTGQNGVGGFVGGFLTSCTIVDSYNSGTISEPVKGNVGGFIGLSTSTKGEIQNCYNIGTIIGPTSGNYASRVGGIAGSLSKSYAIANTYYLDTCSSAGLNVNGAEKKAADDMKSPGFATALNTNSSWKLGLTYPILVCQPDEIALGDISRSGSVDENDVTYLIGHIMETNLLDPELAVLGDMNEDTFIDENDVTYLTQTVLGID